MNTFKTLFLCAIIFGSTFLFFGFEPRVKAEVKKEKVGDVELAYYTRGTGEPLVMIMGFRGTMALWDPALLEILEKRYKLILFDNRGQGFQAIPRKIIPPLVKWLKILPS